MLKEISFILVNDPCIAFVLHILAAGFVIFPPLSSQKSIKYVRVNKNRTNMHVFFHEKKVYKKMRLKWPTSYENHKAQFPKLSVYAGETSIRRHYYIQFVQDGIQIGAFKINKS